LGKGFVFVRMLEEGKIAARKRVPTGKYQGNKTTIKARAP
jgi:hypothetical protein